MMEFSPGVAQSCFEIIDIVARRSLSFNELGSSFSHIGVMPIGKVIQIAQELKWIQANELGITVLTQTGLRLKSILNVELRLRQSILDYIEIQNPVWLQNAPFGRKKLLAFADTAIAQVFLGSLGIAVVGYYRLCPQLAKAS